MKATFIFLLVLTLSTEALAVYVSPFSSAEQKRRGFSLIDNDYEDVRIDYNQDRLIDYWRIRKGPLLIESYFESSGATFHIRRFKGGSVDERVIFSDNGKFYLYLSQTRKQRILTFTKDGPLCIGNQKSEWEKLRDSFKDIEAGNLNVCSENFLDEKCLDTLPTKTYEDLTDITKEIFSPPNSKPNKLLECLESPEALKEFINRFGEAEGKINHDKAVIGFKNSIIKFLDLKKSDNSSVLICRKVEEEAPKVPMKVTEDGSKIQFIFGKNAEKLPKEELKEQLFHESIHISSIADEALTKKITDLCVKGRVQIDKSTLKQSLTNSMRHTNLTLVAEGEKAAAKENSQEIPKNIAETLLPPAKDQSPVEMNRIAEATGVANTAQVSKSQTSGMIRVAEAVLEPAQAVAASANSSSLASSKSDDFSDVSPSSSSYSGNSSSSNSFSTASTNSQGSEKSRSGENSQPPASEYKLDVGKVDTKVPIAQLATKSKRDIASTGEYIKAEIDLTKNSPSKAEDNTKGKATPQSSIPEYSVPPSSKATAGNEIATSSGGTSNSTPSSSSFSFGEQATSSATPSKPMQLNKQSSRTSNYTPSKDEVVSFFARGSYQQARGKLKDQTFIQTLKQNSITVYDLSGNTYGATKGDVIFVDQGDRFVRQK